MFKSIIAAAITALYIASSTVSAQTVFTYQGVLNDAGVPANGLYDMKFELYDTPTGDAFFFYAEDEVLGVTVTDGLFSVDVDLGGLNDSFSSEFYMELLVRSAGGTYTTLSPRKPLAASPRAILANRATKAEFLDLPISQGSTGPSALLNLSNSHASGTGISGSGQEFGIDGFSSAGIGGRFRTSSTAANAVALLGTVSSTSPGAFSAAVRGINNGTGFSGIGVYGSHAGSGWGIYGTSASGLAGAFVGDVSVVGTLSKSGGSFKIDHPQDPENMYLSHSFVESPDMKNIYDGVVILNKQGQATVTLPTYFNALNQDFRYQLTTIGAYAPVFIQSKIESSLDANSFIIAGGTPNLEVSWMVTGVRQDAWANQNRIPTEEIKPDNERGKYLNPEAFGQPKELGIGYQAKPTTNEHPNP